MENFQGFRLPRPPPKPLMMAGNRTAKIAGWGTGQIAVKKAVPTVAWPVGPILNNRMGGPAKIAVKNAVPTVGWAGGPDPKKKGWGDRPNSRQEGSTDRGLAGGPDPK